MKDPRPDTIVPRPTQTSCDSITIDSTTPATGEVSMTIETVERPIEPQSAIMKGA
jgi:hypothetical protein